MLTLIQWAAVIFIVLLIFLLVKFKYVKHKLTWIIVFILIIIGYLGFFISTHGQNIDLNSVDGVMTAGKLYFSWLGNSFSNLKTISSNAVKLDWTSNNTDVINSINDKEK